MPGAGGNSQALGSGKNTSGQAKARKSQAQRLSELEEVSDGMPSMDSLARLSEPERLAFIKRLLDVRKGQENREREIKKKKLEKVKADVAKAIAERDAPKKGESSKDAGNTTTTASTSPKPSASTPAAATSKNSGANADTTDKKTKKSKGKKKPDPNAA